MKAISLTQPWATLVAIGAKKIETRSWSTPYRGPLAIHAAKGWTNEAVEQFFVEPFHTVLTDAGFKLYSLLPRGCVVATCELVAVKRIHHADKVAGWQWFDPDQTHYRFDLDQQERCFGDYTTGRWAWMLHNVERLVEPIPARGALILWEWHR